MKTLLTALFFSFLYSPHEALAFPEMIRHNYPNCIACHESPSGGGLLNQYGRTISHAVLSTWGGEKESRPFYGAFDNKYTSSWLNIGGDLRALQLHTNSKTLMQGMFIRMQTGIEAAVTYKQFKAVSFFGKQEEENMVRGESVRHYLMYQATDNLSIRAGRFMPNFGINIAEHTMPTKRGLGFDQGAERDQVEVMWGGEMLNVSGSLNRTVKTELKKTREDAFTAQVNYTLFNSFRLGANVWLGKEAKSTREIYGVNAVLGFTEKLYYLTEFDLQYGFNNKRGLYHFSKLGFEIIKGFHILGVEDYQQSDLKNEKSLTNSHGAGFQWFPRPHFDFEGIWNKKRVAQRSTEYTDYAYLMLHYYF